MWLAHRRSRQGSLLELLCSSHEPVNLELGLYHWLAESKTGATAKYLAVSSKWREEVEMAVWKIDRILIPDQRVHFSSKLQRLIQDIEGLAGKDKKKCLGV
jgi:hypothetical protein